MADITDFLIGYMRQRSAQWYSAGQPDALIGLLERADQLRRKRAWNEAIDSCAFIVQISVEQSNSLIRAAAHFYRGVIFHNWQKQEPARTAYDQACNLFWLLGNSRQHEYALTKWALATLKQSMDEYDGALYDYLEAATVFKRLHLESIKRAEPVPIAGQYQKMIEEIGDSTLFLLDRNYLIDPLAYTFPIYTFPIMESAEPPPKPARRIIYFRDSHRFSIEGKVLQAVTTASIPSWKEFDDQLDLKVPYFAVQAVPAMAGIAGIQADDYLVVCLTQDTQLPRRRNDPNTLALIQNRDGSYQIAPKIIGQSHKTLFAYVDVVLKKVAGPS
jgi:hypothetical protein